LLLIDCLYNKREEINNNKTKLLFFLTSIHIKSYTCLKAEEYNEEK